MRANEYFIKEQIKKLIEAFPSSKYQIERILLERIVHYEFTRLEVKEAVYNAIDTVNKEYITVADVIQPILKDRKTIRFKSSFWWNKVKNSTWWHNVKIYVKYWQYRLKIQH
jgi:hypothetical protein